MSERVLITGVTGFVGSHLAEYLLNKGYEVHGLYRWRSDRSNIKQIEQDIHLIIGDIRDMSSMLSVIEDTRPKYVFHLASQSFVHESWNSPTETLFTNIIGTTNLLEALTHAEWTADKIILAGSSEEYGLVHPNETPIKETNQLRPLSPYAISKVATDLLGIMYHRSFDLHVTNGRAFNHEGPRRGDVFVTSNFARQIALIEKGLQKPVIEHGNLEAKRDWTDVRDVVKAYLLLAKQGESGQSYNICSETTRSVREMLEVLLSFSHVEIEMKQDLRRVRPSDVELLLGDCTKFRELTGWKPEIDFVTTMLDLLNYWRERV